MPQIVNAATLETTFGCHITPTGDAKMISIERIPPKPCSGYRKLSVVSDNTVRTKELYRFFGDFIGRPDWQFLKAMRYLKCGF